MPSQPLSQNLTPRFLYIGLAIFLASALWAGLFETLQPNRPPIAQAAALENHFVYLPMTLNTESPAGSYSCNEYEFGMIWSYDYITLNADGTSLYTYPWSAGTPSTGTWRYTTHNRQVEFTGFRWLTTTYLAPDRLWASQYIPSADFEIAISCQQQ